jgi:signal transduction histidine kinase
MSVNPPPNPPPPPPSSPQPDPHPHGRPGTKRPHKEPADRAGAGGTAHGGHHEPVLKRTVVKPAGIVPDPVDAAYVANRLTALTHELANLLDGSLRVINLARKPGVDETPEHVSKHIETVYAAMLQMADLVRNSMTGLAPVGNDGLRHALGATGSLAIAVNHAVNVMKPVAEERSIELVCEAGPELNDAPAGPIYGVIINGVKNAIESIQRSGQTDGRVVVRAWMEAGRTGRCVGIEISDNGEGPPPLPAAHAGKGKGRSVFDVGVTSKEGGAGIGLALCKEVIEHLGGTIELVRRNGGGTKGAVLKVRYPAPAPMTDRHVG